MPAYSEKDFTKVTDAAGNVQPDEVPKPWIGTPLLPEGTKAASKTQVEKAEADS